LSDSHWEVLDSIARQYHVGTVVDSVVVGHVFARGVRGYTGPFEDAVPKDSLTHQKDYTVCNYNCFHT
jgi:hypothetical protein